MGLRFHSTNRNTPEVDFKTALLKGLAPDKGLYTPNEYPSIADDELLEFAELDYPELGFKVLTRLIGDQLPEDQLKRICTDAYDFPVPVVNISKNCSIMHLDQGPTASFKDFAARTMARLMKYFISIEGRELLILTATSGDTGGAVASAFHNVEGIKVVVLFPKDEVSDRQRKQMTTLGDNVTAVAIDGKFDDCQAIVKRAFADPDLSGLGLSSANSINVGRLIPQSVYYFWGYFRAHEDTIADGNLPLSNISVPCGNFGNLMGGMIAKALGLPVGKYIAAVNENDEFPRFLNSGVYKKIQPSKKSLSNAMNVGHPSNLARIVDLYGGIMNHEGLISKLPAMDKMRKDVFSTSISDEETKFIIKEVYQKYEYILEPHGAVGWGGLQRYLELHKEESLRNISIETADPAKFPELITEVLDIDPKVPNCLKKMQEKEEQYVRLKKKYQKFKGFLQANFS